MLLFNDELIVDPTPTPTIPSATPSTRSSGRRIVSNASIADPDQDSAGGNRVLASNEKSSDVFANNFMEYVIGWIWPDGITLDWVQGRIGTTTLNWNNSYLPAFPTLRASPAQVPLPPSPLSPPGDYVV